MKGQENWQKTVRATPTVCYLNSLSIKFWQNNDEEPPIVCHPNLPSIPTCHPSSLSAHICALKGTAHRACIGLLRLPSSSRARRHEWSAASGGGDVAIGRSRRLRGCGPRRPEHEPGTQRCHPRWRSGRFPWGPAATRAAIGLCRIAASASSSAEAGLCLIAASASSSSLPAAAGERTEWEIGSLRGLREEGMGSFACASSPSSPLPPAVSSPGTASSLTCSSVLSRQEEEGYKLESESFCWVLMQNIKTHIFTYIALVN
jgi:hypothetical protein